MTTISMTYPQLLRRQATVDGRVVRFGVIQIAVLSHLLMNRGTVVKHGDLYAHLWPNPDCEPEDVGVYISVVMARLRQKVPGLITCLRGVGYMLQKEGDYDTAPPDTIGPPCGRANGNRVGGLNSHKFLGINGRRCAA